MVATIRSVVRAVKDRGYGRKAADYHDKQEGSKDFPGRRKYPGSPRTAYQTPGIDEVCERDACSLSPARSPTLFDPAEFPPSPTPTLFTPSAPSPALSLASFACTARLGKGASGVVFSARHRASGRLVAVKLVKKHMERNVWVRGEQEALRRVVGVRGAVQMMASFEEREGFCLVMEYCPGGSLARELRRVKRLSPSRAQFITASLISTLSELHALRLIHRDIKPGNVLFSADGAVVLADFGLSVAFDEYDEEEKVSGDAGTWAFMAPEMFVGESYGYEVDFWAVGVLLYLMLFGKVPFGRRARYVEDLVNCIMQDPLYFGHTRVDAKTQDFLQKILNRDSERRLTRVEDIKAHPYFDNIDWNMFHGPTSRSPAIHADSRAQLDSEYVAFDDVPSLPFAVDGTPWDGPEYPDFHYVSPELVPLAKYEADSSKAITIPHHHFPTKSESIARHGRADGDRRRRRKWYKPFPM
ncbi:kinase-like protein [Gloeophyllum trabeum ATCC 11539]|uniref:Kinase-like protein n=1 Tax=Gloeophyllum trabeum (strain ATCC 11539 / FP-39264 / Madison 617) TaxID=670483 RepID=S7PTS5_GLOTA|nr:kinase-like protein [Gloeophyllum trabeum ATCC 11539]EPQ51201.1 kinase-like protein [Gloeophyllum trabeum ATCC 11539]